MKLTKETENEVLKVYDTWLHAYVTGDVKTYDQYLDDAYHFIGSTNNEEFLSREATTKFFEDTAEQFAGKTELRNESKTLEQFGELIFITHVFDAWFLSEADWAYYGRFRFTSVLRKNKEGWRFIYQHFSMPDSKAQEGETIGYDQISAENLQLREAIQRRTVELENKNRELEIETALERVRTRAMAMQHSGELSQLVNTLFQELTKLDFALTFCIINVINEADRSNTVWAADPLTGRDPESYYMKFEDYEFHHGMWDAWKSRKNKWVYTMEGPEKESYDEYLYRDTEFRRFPIEVQEANRALDRYVCGFTFSNFGGLQTVSEEPISDVNLDILARFGKVFDLTYTRFNDLKQAEAQALEARIDLALERIRAQALAMRESADLLDIVVTMRTEFVNLGHEAQYFWHMRWLPEIYEKAMTSGDGTRIGMVMELPRHIHGNIPLLAEWEKSDKPTVIYAMDAEAAVDYVDKMINLGDFKQVDPNAPSPDDIRHIGGLTFIMARTTHGEIGYSLPGKVEEVPQSDLDILIRFAGAFDLAHKRFEDLKKSEQQAREVQIELALEKVRSRTMGMQKSDELKEVVKVIFDQLAHLDINAEHAGIVVDYEPEKDWHFWVAENQDIPSRISVPYLDLPWDRQFAQARENGVDFFTTHLDFEEKNSFYQELLPHIPGLTEETRDFYFKCPGLAISTTLQEDIGLYIENFSGIPYSEAENAILKRFGKVFQQTYTRFLDLQKAEAQAREARIETALEKVRSRTMAMQKSEELADAAFILFEQLRSLGGNLWGTGFGLCEKDREKDQFWFAYEKGVLPPAYVPNTTDPAHKKMHQGWKNKKDVLSIVASGENLKKHYEYMMSLPEVRPFFQEILDKGLSFPEWQQWNAAYFTHGYLLIITLDPYPEPEILSRFARVFDQTYTRFLDLKKAEAQARESEIQLALERVRASTMAMHTSEELSGVASVLFEQMKNLGGELFSFGIVLCDKHENMVEQWHSLGNKGMITPFLVPVNLDYIHQYRYDQWKAGEALFSIEIPEGYIQEHFELMFDLPSVKIAMDEVAAKGVEVEIPSWEIDYGASFSHGYLLVSSLKPFQEDHVFPRFAKVFEQAYTRFLDLQKAEAQAREARINLGVERVRATALAMHKSEDIMKVVAKLKDEVMDLDIPDVAAATIFLNETDGKIRMWDLTSIEKREDGFQVPLDITFTLKKTDPHLYVKRVWENPANYFIETQDEKGLKRIMEWLREHGKAEVAREVEEYVDSAGIKLLYHATKKLNNGKLCIDVLSHPKEEMEMILTKMGAAFDLAYRRFEDLQKAEAQAREAQIETALEKVRSKTMAMQHSDDLPEAANALFLEIQALGIPAWSCGYNILAEDLRSATCWMSSEGALQAPFKLRLYGEASFEEMGEFLRSNKSFLMQELGGKAIEDHYDYMKSFPDLLPTFEHIEEQGLSLPTYQINHLCRFTYGFLLFITYEPVPESHDIFKRFTKVFEQTYTRFLDLQKAEAQAREAQVESALERVRARSMAMHKSEELAGLSLELVKQVQALGVKTWFCAFNIYDDDPQGSLEWGSNGQGTFPKYRTPMEGVFLRYYEAGQKGETLLVNEIGANECAAHYEYLCSLPGVGDQLLKMKEAGIPFPVSQIDHVAYFKYGYILFITYEPTPESHDIFKRFARVFEQTYTRFLDLKNVEAQTRSAHIEAALERVRARALAMQEPEELTEVAEVLRYEMGLLGVEELETSSIFINDGENQKAECWYAIKDIRSDVKKLVSDHFPLNLDDTWVGREMKKFYASTRDQVSIVMRGATRKEWISYCANQSGPLKGYYGEEIPDRTYHLFKFSHGAIGAASAGKISGESWDLLKRAAAVFSLAYSRFKDLTQARLDLQKLKEEKKRAEEALKELQVTQTQLIQSEKMASLGELTAGIAHEIQNPLNFVNNFSEVSVELLEEMDEELEKGDLEEARVLVEDIKQNLEKINHHGKRADGIVKGMLQHSRSSNGQKEPTDLNALADEYLRLAYHGLRAKDKGFNANLETHFDDTIGKVNVVSQDIGRVILNLITNAFYVVKEKKEQQHQGYEPTVTVTTKKEGNKVMIMVKDNGNGIPDAVREKIFQPFFTTKPTGQGTGLGLSMSYDIVTKGHGGELKVETREGEGTEFRIVLPGKEK